MTTSMDRENVELLRSDMDQRFAEVEQRFNKVDLEFAQLRRDMDVGFAELRGNEKTLAARFDAVDARFEAVDARFEALGHQLDAKFSKLTNVAIFSAVGLGSTILAAAAIIRTLFA